MGNSSSAATPARPARGARASSLHSSSGGKQHQRNRTSFSLLDAPLLIRSTPQKTRTLDQSSQPHTDEAAAASSSSSSSAVVESSSKSAPLIPLSAAALSACFVSLSFQTCKELGRDKLFEKIEQWAAAALAVTEPPDHSWIQFWISQDDADAAAEFVSRLRQQHANAYPRGLNRENRRFDGSDEDAIARADAAAVAAAAKGEQPPRSRGVVGTTLHVAVPAEDLREHKHNHKDQEEPEKKLPAAALIDWVFHVKLDLVNYSTKEHWVRTSAFAYKKFGEDSNWMRINERTFYNLMVRANIPQDYCGPGLHPYTEQIYVKSMDANKTASASESAAEFMQFITEECKRPHEVMVLVYHVPLDRKLKINDVSVKHSEKYPYYFRAMMLPTVVEHEENSMYVCVLNRGRCVLNLNTVSKSEVDAKVWHFLRRCLENVVENCAIFPGADNYNEDGMAILKGQLLNLLKAAKKQDYVQSWTPADCDGGRIDVLMRVPPVIELKRDEDLAKVRKALDDEMKKDGGKHKRSATAFQRPGTQVMDMYESMYAHILNQAQEDVKRLVALMRKANTLKTHRHQVQVKSTNREYATDIMFEAARVCFPGNSSGTGAPQDSSVSGGCAWATERHPVTGNEILYWTTGSEQPRSEREKSKKFVW